MTAVASGSDYYGRTGFPLSATGGTADFAFDAAGQLVRVGSRGLIDLNYNRQGLPSQITFDDGSIVNFRTEVWNWPFYVAKGYLGDWR